MRGTLGVFDELHESVVHVKLHMAMEERITRVVRNEVDCDRIERHDVDDIFFQSAELFFANLRYFKGVTVQVHRVLIWTSVDHDKAITFALLHLDGVDIGP